MRVVEFEMQEGSWWKSEGKMEKWVDRILNLPSLPKIASK